MNVISKISFFVILYFCLSFTAAAKCEMFEYQASGKVTTKNSPIADATIQANWVERGSNMSSSAYTDRNGQFELKVLFDSFSGRTLLGREKCEAKLTSVKLKVVKTGYKTKNVKASFKQGKSESNIALTPSR